MKVFAFCAASFRDSVRRAAGVEPVLSPPVDVESFCSLEVAGRGFYYFKLHGLSGESFWYGDDWVTAVGADQIRALDLEGAVVFAANCYLYEYDPAGRGVRPHVLNGTVLNGQYRSQCRAWGPMFQALCETGARAVVGGGGQNFGARYRVTGADYLGMAFRQALQVGLAPARAFAVARARIGLRLAVRFGLLAKERAAIRDALGFRIFERGKDYD